MRNHTNDMVFHGAKMKAAVASLCKTLCFTLKLREESLQWYFTGNKCT